MEYVKCSLKFHYKVVVEAKGMASRLCIMWKKGILASQMEFKKNLIAIKISGAICQWLLVGFYGSPYHSKKKKARENLTALLEANQGLWVCMGDFNYTINDDKRKGGKKGSTSKTNHLKDLMFEFGAINLWYSRSKFTWAKGKWGNAAIKRKLDK